MGQLLGNLDEGECKPTSIMSLSKVPFTRDIDIEALANNTAPMPMQESKNVLQDETTAEGMHITARRRTTVATTTVGTYKITESKISKTWRVMPLPEPLSQAHRGKARKYPNTPLSIEWYESGMDCFLFVGLLCSPNVLKIIPPRHHEPDKSGRFNVLPIDSQRVLLADESSHQIWLVNHQYKMMKHLAGCGKRGYLDGPLEICWLNSPCSMTLDPRSHYIYIADRGNHVIRKIDLLSGLMSTAVGNGTRGNCDSGNRKRQALDSPFEVSFAEPHYLIISCADNSIRSFNLKTGYLETLLVGS